MYLLEGVFCDMCLAMDVNMVNLRLSQMEVNGLVWGSVKSVLKLVMSCVTVYMSTLEEMKIGLYLCFCLVGPRSVNKDNVMVT